MVFSSCAENLKLNIMGRYKSFIEITGSIDGLSFYEGGLVKKKNKSYQPTSEGTLRNMAEFGAGSTLGRHFRYTFLPVSKAFGEQSTCSRLGAAFKKVISYGTGPWGERAFDLKNRPDEVLGFQFQKPLSVRQVLTEDLLRPELNAARDTVHWDLPAFVPRTAVMAPREASHFQLVLVVAPMSPGAYSKTHKSYQPLLAMPFGSAGVSRSAYLDLDAATIELFMMEAVLNLPLPLPDAMSVVSCVGVVFGKTVNGTIVAIKDGRAMDVLGVG